jgi:hypothetical protein
MARCGDGVYVDGGGCGGAAGGGAGEGARVRLRFSLLLSDSAELKWVSVLCSCRGRRWAGMGRTGPGAYGLGPTGPLGFTAQQWLSDTAMRAGEAAEWEGGRRNPGGAAQETMPAEGTRMARLWEREVGRLPPKRFADAVMASEVQLPPLILSLLPAHSQLHCA